MKSTVIKHIEKLSKNTIPAPDAAGNFYDYPLQSLFTITHGGTKSGHVDLIKSSKFIITENDFVFHSEDENLKFQTYEEAENACIDKLIEIVKNRLQSYRYFSSELDEEDRMVLVLKEIM